jgi:hypothetical protein
MVLEYIPVSKKRRYEYIRTKVIPIAVTIGAALTWIYFYDKLVKPRDSDEKGLVEKIVDYRRKD